MSRLRFGYLLALVLCAFGPIGFSLEAPAQQPPAPSQAAAPTEPLRTASDRPITIRNIKLDLKVDLEKKKVASQAAVSFQCIKPASTLNLDAVGFEVKSVLLADESKPSTRVPFTHDGKTLRVNLGATWPVGHSGKVVIDYVVQEPKDGLHFFAPSKSSPEAPLQVWSQGESISNRYWIPCVDEPDQRQTTEIVCTVPQGFEAVSNGKLVERRENSSDKTVTFDWLQDKPHPAYLMTLVVSQFEVVQEEWDGMPVIYYVPKGHKAEALPTYGKTRDILTFFSNRFGIRYPWDKYAQVTCYQYGGGMENTSATTMGDFILQDERSLLDGNSEWIIAHEMAHQWWGDMVTCRDWSHTWLNEGFASYAEPLWDEQSKGRDEYALNMFQKASGAISAGKTRPVMDRRYPNPDSMFDGRSYPKGAWVLHMLRNRLGDEAFFAGIKKYGTEFKFQSAETMDLRRVLERSSGRDLERFFYDWLERAGNPELEVATEYLSDAKQAKVVIKQTQAGEPFQFPLKINLYCAGSEQPTVISEDMTEKEISLRVALPGQLERVEVDPDQAVLAVWKENKSRDLWREQLAHGTTVPVRMRAMRHFEETKDTADSEFLVNAFKDEKFHAIKIALANAIGTAGGSSARDALLAGLQDADARIRRACLSNLGKFKGDEAVNKKVRDILQNGDASYAVEGAALEAYAKLGNKDALAVATPWLAKRSHQDVLAIAALGAIGALEDPAALETLLSWTQPGHPSRVRSAAMRGLGQLVKSKKLSDAQNQTVLKSFISALENDDRLLGFMTLNALPDLGPLAVQAIPAIEKASENLPGNAKEMAKNVIKRIRDQSKPAASTEATELRQVRDELKRMQREVEELRKKVEKNEKASKP
jgi:aminopeptidase N